MAMRQDLLAGVLFLVGCFAASTSGVISGPAPDPTLSIRDLKEAPTAYAGTIVIVQGQLRLESRSYFNHPRFVIVDSEGQKISVKPWAPLEVPPPMPGAKESPQNRPTTMNTYLGLWLSVTGLFNIDPRNEESVIEVRSAVELAQSSSPAPSDGNSKAVSGTAKALPMPVAPTVGAPSAAPPRSPVLETSGPVPTGEAPQNPIEAPAKSQARPSKTSGPAPVSNATLWARPASPKASGSSSTTATPLPMSPAPGAEAATAPTPVGPAIPTDPPRPTTKAESGSHPEARMQSPASPTRDEGAATSKADTTAKALPQEQSRNKKARPPETPSSETTPKPSPDTPQPSSPEKQDGTHP